MMFTAGGQPDLHVVLRGGVGKGGGGGTQQFATPPPQYVDPVDGTVYTDPIYSTDQKNNFPDLPTGADLLNQHIQQRQAAAKTTSDANAATAAQTQGQNQVDFQNTRNKSYYDALGNIQRQFQLQGVDPAQYEQSDIEPRLNTIVNQIPNLDPNPGSAFSPTLGTDILNDLTSGRRTQVTNQLNSQFDPNYATNLIPDSTLDQYVPSVVSAQFDPLSTQLTNAQKRGTLTGAGYDAALAALNQKRDAATSQVSDLGMNILGTDRSGINDLIGGARSTAAGLTLGQQFDPTSYDTQARTRANTDISNFGGALTNAVGDTKFATLSELLNAGGAVQGANNPSCDQPNWHTGCDQSIRSRPGYVG